MLFPTFVLRRLALKRYARLLAAVTLSAGLIGWTALAWTQTPSAAEETIKKALQAGQLQQARQLVQKEIKNSPESVQWRFMDGVILAQQGQIDLAIDTFKQITQSHPDHSEAYNNLGVLYASKGQLETSKAFLEKALLTHPSYAAAHRNLSDVHSKLAKQSYAKALQIDPKAKADAPQLTLLGSMSNPQRGLSPVQSVASLKPPVSPVLASGQAASTPAPPAPPTLPLPPTPTSAASPAAPAQKPPATAPAPTATAATKPATDTRQAKRVAIEKAVQDWAKAWSNKDMPRYYAAYANNFTPAKWVSRAQWEADRRIRIMTKKSISVEIREIQIGFSGETASVRFKQLYTSDDLKVNSRKTLEMMQKGDRWLIVRESVN